ncbi:MAG: hypothetical protein K6B64_00660 [Acholeplasmatales bacterium]|nr:hypothetical protein [Acholeplasmatales bacterium]
MKDYLKRYYKEVILVIFYIAIACAAYICWFETLWHLWYVDMITGLAIIFLGGTVGFLYIRSLEKARLEKEASEKPIDNKEKEEVEASNV